MSMVGGSTASAVVRIMGSIRADTDRPSGIPPVATGPRTAMQVTAGRRMATLGTAVQHTATPGIQEGAMLNLRMGVLPMAAVRTAAIHKAARMAGAITTAATDR
jgi:hypothetical protein